MNVTQKLYKVCSKPKLYFKRSSPLILSCIAAVGVVGTAVAAAKATVKAAKLIESAADENKKLTKAEAVRIAVPVYLPTAAIGFGTIFCIFGANVISRKKQASLISAYGLLNSHYKEYREKLIEQYGKETDNEIRNAIAREYCDCHQIGLDVPDGKFIFYDEISGETIICYEREIMDAEYHLNRNFTMRGYAFLNEFYEFLGLPMTEYGGTVGWSMSSGIMWIDFEHRLINKDDGGTPCYSIDMIFCPEVLEEWEC